MSGRQQSRYASSNPGNLGQTTLSLIGYLCFAVFVVCAVVFTVNYEPRDPHFLPASKIGNFLPSEPDPNQAALESLFNDTDLDSLVGHGPEESLAGPDARVCKAEDPIDCRDPDLFHLLMRATIEKFKDVHFYRFGKPVEGDNGSSCHMAWRYRPKDSKPASFNKDYRSFVVSRSKNCTMSVVGIGEYHSGVNARKKKGKAKKRPEDNNNNSNTTLAIEVGETANDELPEVLSEGSFIRGKYLVYSGGGDRCKSMHQYLWSFTCMLGEALFLNRTLVMDLSLCLSKIYSSFSVDEEGKDFRFYFDYEHLKDSASVLDRTQFWSAWDKWQQKGILGLHLVEDFRVTTVKLAEVKDALIMRKFGSVEPDNYWYRVCEGEAEPIIKRPWHMIRKSRRLLDIASGIVSRLNSDFDAVRVERREKVKNKEIWPNLYRDTSPEAIMVALRGRIEVGRDLYIATDERDVSFFDNLKGKYSTHFLDDYKDLWDGNSDWFDEMTRLNNGNAVEFDGYMRTLVNSEVFLKGKKQVETFNDLTRDCKDGVGTCTLSG
ncbi:Unknown protein [Striga hermonthica]|uniref:O-fucosyltransferase family protein n=1 Tax=Striga hermonthica TaxID=68872 RepID=A0A9N7NVN5_STRHE|nr:Unknown protein [Striga hermonthica]